MKLPVFSYSSIPNYYVSKKFKVTIIVSFFFQRTWPLHFVQVAPDLRVLTILKVLCKVQLSASHSLVTSLACFCRNMHAWAQVFGEVHQL